MPQEYNNNASKSSYASMNNYNNNRSLQGIPPTGNATVGSSNVPSMSLSIIPQFGAISNDALTHAGGESAGNGYFTVNGAYPSSAPGGSGCTSFSVQSSC